MEIEKHFIKIVVPCYNIGKSGHVRMVDSVLSQKFKENYHLVLVDDCSSDDGTTIAALEGYAKSNPDLVTVVRNETNLGPGETRNRGHFMTIESHPSEYLWFLDADDHLADDGVFDRVHGFLVENPEMDMLYVGIDFKGRKMIANEDCPYGPWGSVVRTRCYVPFISECIKGGEDTYQHLVQMDAIPPERVGRMVDGGICYVYTGNHSSKRIPRESLLAVQRHVSSIKFTQQRTIDCAKTIDRNWRKWFRLPFLSEGR